MTDVIQIYEELYKNSLPSSARSRSQIEERAKRALLWVLGASRPLESDEYFTLQQESTHISKLCRNFLHQTENGTVVVSHSTVRDYLSLKYADSDQVGAFLALQGTSETTEKARAHMLEKARERTNRAAQEKIATECLVYLDESVAATGKNDGLTSDGSIKNPLLLYAASMWFKHVHACTDRDGKIPGHLFDRMKTILSTNIDNDAFRRWLTIFDPDHPRGWRMTSAGPLYYAVLLDFPEMAKLLLERGVSPVDDAGSLGYPLQLACYRNQQELVELMLKPGVGVNAVDNVLGTPLQAAIAGGHLNLVLKLLECHKADVNARGGRLGNALQVAVAMGDKAILQALALHGMHQDTRGHQLWVEAWANVPQLSRQVGFGMIRSGFKSTGYCNYRAWDFPDSIPRELSLLGLCIALSPPGMLQLLPKKREQSSGPSLLGNLFERAILDLPADNLDSASFVPERVLWLILIAFSRGNFGFSDAEDRIFKLGEMLHQHSQFLRHFNIALPFDLHDAILNLFEALLIELLTKEWVRQNLFLLNLARLFALHEPIKVQEGQALLMKTMLLAAQEASSENIQQKPPRETDQTLVAAIRDITRELSELRRDIRGLTTLVQSMRK